MFIKLKITKKIQINMNNLQCNVLFYKTENKRKKQNVNDGYGQH